MEKILVIDNDNQTRRMLLQTFADSGFRLGMVADFASAISIFDVDAPVVVIMELRVYGFDAQDFCRELRRRSFNVPIVVLSTARAESDKVVLLETVADDYITKPFNSRELLARVRAAVRRHNQNEMNGYDNQAFGDVQVSFRNMEVFRQGVAVQLTSQEFKVLRFFLTHADRAETEKKLLEQVWGGRAHPGSHTVATHILHLTKKLERFPTEPVHLLTLHGIGYKFVK